MEAERTIYGAEEFVLIRKDRLDSTLDVIENNLDKLVEKASESDAPKEWFRLLEPIEQRIEDMRRTLEELEGGSK